MGPRSRSPPETVIPRLWEKGQRHAEPPGGRPATAHAAAARTARGSSLTMACAVLSPLPCRGDINPSVRRQGFRSSVAGSGRRDTGCGHQVPRRPLAPRPHEHERALLPISLSVLRPVRGASSHPPRSVPARSGPPILGLIRRAGPPPSRWLMCSPRSTFDVGPRAHVRNAPGEHPPLPGPTRMSSARPAVRPEPMRQPGARPAPDILGPGPPQPARFTRPGR